MAYSTQELQRVHPEYAANRKRLQFLGDSYEGGAAYARGGYLTRYVFESGDEYEDRIAQTPLDNHCRSIISIYNSFIFAKPPKRDFGTLNDDPQVNHILEDADYEGRSWDSFMREVNIQASVYGHAWVVVDRPAVDVITRADEIAYEVRPYVCLYSALNVLDWHYERAANGKYELTFLKVLESEDQYQVILNLFYPDRVERVRYERTAREGQVISVTPTLTGRIPAVCVYNQRSSVRGFGLSDLNDIADIQRAIYDELSEVEQLIRISNHPSLVSTAGIQAMAGAGARIIVDDNTDPGLKPYLLQPTAQSLDGIRAAITDKITAINQMANVSSIRTTESRTVSGVSRDVEFRLLNSHLTAKADQLELAEEQIWTLIFEMMGYPDHEFYIDYPETFNTRDKMNDLTLLEKAKAVLAMAPLPNAVVDREITHAVIELILEDQSGYQDAVDSVEQGLDSVAPHVMTDPITGQSETVTTAQRHNELMALGWQHQE
jgi:hypothetical protein